LNHYVGKSDFDHSYCSSEMAVLMAHAARSNATMLGMFDFHGRPLVGVSCTAALSSNYARRGADRAFICLSGSDGMEVQARIEFDQTLSRTDQDFLTTSLLLFIVESSYGDESIKWGDHPGVTCMEVVETRSAVEDKQKAIEALIGNPAMGYVVFMSNRIHFGFLNDTSGLGKRMLICSGSFNPFHAGHIALANAALKKLENRHLVFEIAVQNVDKGAINVPEVLSRLDQFLVEGENDFHVVVSGASRFVDKSRLFPGAAFAIGYDTAIRLIDTKYYENNQERMQQALLEIQSLGCIFVVGGRLDGNTFKDFSFMVDQIPLAFRSLFVALKEEDFRLDLSSTEIRETRLKS